ncbi:AfsR/SARP family transcriptional regulator [Solihabitans fulvus]|uniref:AfsR/SARP family transcriptional regulator n=1 Tax=Solihabitans fulvus TaxID=1892852 RepID=UPI001661C240|nr:BTAD domain-containing putative transcriptional regulator [Solihabitans fulvus]
MPVAVLGEERSVKGSMFGLLGPLEVLLDGRIVPIAAGKRRALLATLALRAGEPVSMDELVDRLWGAEAGAGAVNAVQTTVRRLRADLARGAHGREFVRTRSRGYLLDVAADEVDLGRFRSLLDRATRAERDGGIGAAADTLREAIGLWRGEPLADVRNDSLHRDVVPVLVEQRLAAVERRIDLDLRLGRHDHLIAELRTLTALHPLRERLWARLMLALYRADRRADALHAYRTLGDTLAEELGLDPGEELRRLHHRVLLGDPTLLADPAATPGGAPSPGRATVDTAPVESAPAGTDPNVKGRNELPGEVADFTGRDTELRLLLDEQAAADTVSVVAIDGMAGVGKTSLAVRVAHRLAPRYPDAQLFIDLHGHSSGVRPTAPDDALHTLLVSLGVAEADIPAPGERRAARWRAELAGRRALVVLDNAATAAQVRPLLPGSAGCLVLVTSRRRLLDLDTARGVSLDALDEDDALALLSGIAGADRIAAEPDAAGEVVQLCGHLPLAIRIAGARLRTRPAWTVRGLANRLADSEERLAELTAGDRSVAGAFALSYQHLDAPRQRMFRLLGLHPGPDWDSHLAAVLTETSPRQAELLLEDLVDAHLLQQAEPGRYRFHDLLGHHANATARREETQARQHEAVGRVLDYYLHTASVAIEPLTVGYPRLPLDLDHPPAHVPDVRTTGSALAWYEAEHANLTAAAVYAADHGWQTHAWRLPHAIQHFFSIRGHTKERIATSRLAVAATRHLSDPDAHAEARKSLGTAYWQAGRYEEALEHLRRALILMRDTGNLRGEASVHGNLGTVANILGDYAGALDHFERGLVLMRRAGTRTGEAAAVHNLGVVHAQLGRHAKARECFETALAIRRELGDTSKVASLLADLAHVSYDTGRDDDVDNFTRLALATYREHGDTRAEALALSDFSYIYRHLARNADAVDWARRVLHLLDSATSGATLVALREVGDHRGELAVLQALTLVSEHSGRYTEAVGHAERTLELTRAISNKWAEPRVLGYLSMLHRELGNHEAALGYARQALEAIRSLGDRRGECEILLDLGAAHLAMGDAEAALACYERSRAVADEIGCALPETTARQLIAELPRQVDSEATA